MARERQTLMDWMVIGISPALIMGMVGSLLFFLLTLFYHGQYAGRLSFIFAMFTLAIVLIARISMEEGIEYASMFAIPLAIVTALALAKFVQITGPLASLSNPINWCLMGLVWWSAHKLTWDCTFIDDQQDASGEGLLQAAGFDGETVERQAGDTPADEAATTAEQGQESWYDRMVARRRRPHTPGVWVMYYALAALPLFGVGQWLIPASATAARWHAFRLICVYLACAMGLLLTTSFLGLRRYLRQRNLQMPLDMAGLWLAAGGVMIVVLLGVCMVLPRPGASLTVSQLPFGVGSPKHQRTNPHALGNDGPERPQEATRTNPQAQQPPSPSAASSDQQSAGPGGEGAGKQPSAQGAKQSPSSGPAQSSPSDGRQGDAAESGERPDKMDNMSSDRGPQASQQGHDPNTQSGQPSSPDRQGKQQPGSSSGDNGRQPNNAASGRKQESDSSAQGTQPRDAAQPGDREAATSRQTQPGGQQVPEQQPEGGRQFQGDRQPSQSSPPQQAAEDKEQSSPSSQSSRDSRSQQPWAAASRTLMTLASGAANLVKLLFFALLACAAIFFAWKHRAQLVQALAQLWRDLLNFWARLWGRRAAPAGPTAAGEAGPAGPSLPSFASYRDPFRSGAGERYTMEQLVRYSFEALEAWGREHDCARHEDETPLEYAQQIARRHAALGPETQVLADLYCRMAYGREQVGSQRRENLRRLWQQLHAAAG